MKNFKGEIIIKPDNTGTTTLWDIGERIHNQLVGNPDYVNSNIGVNVNDERILIWFDDCEGEIPDIVF